MLPSGGKIASAVTSVWTEFSMTKKRVAVIGSGASGLICARECVREGHEVTVFEKTKASGGTWVLDKISPELQQMDIYQDGYDKVARTHTSSMYEELRLNSPRHIMGVTDFPFDTNFPGSKDPRCFPRREEVRSTCFSLDQFGVVKLLRYLDAFKKRFDLEKLITYETDVTQVKPVDDGTNLTWKVKVQSKKETKDFEFDAVSVCIGHYTVPKLPKVKDIEKFEKPCLHSHLYRTAKIYKDQTVVILGNGPSGFDICLDIGNYAKKVFVCARHWNPYLDTSKPVGSRNNVHLCGNISHCVSKGTVQLEDGTILDELDVLLLCTGYYYDFSFLEPKDMISTTNDHVYPVYKHCIHPKYTSLAFIELQVQDISFLCAEYQSVYFARLLSGKCSLPTEEEMMKDIHSIYKDLEERNLDVRHYHSMEHNQFVYLEEISKLCGYTNKVAKWREEFFKYTLYVLREQRLLTYRDDPFPQELLDKAAAEFELVWNKSTQPEV